MSHKDGKKKEEQPEIKKGLAALLTEADIAGLKASIDEIKDPFLESEKVLTGESAKYMREVAEHVRNCKTVFVSPDLLDSAPKMPAGIDEEFDTPIQITVQRQRAYFLDIDGILRELNCEARQEPRPDGTIKQVVKVGKGGNLRDSTMDRLELAAKLLRFGFNIYAVGDKELRHQLMDNLQSPPKPVERLVSQRIRLPYHPEGNPDVLIEMAIEPIHVGETFTGFVWSKPKLDLEIKKGPPAEDRAARHAILETERSRVRSIFSLTDHFQSSPTPGFDVLTEELKMGDVRRRFEEMPVDAQWWKSLPPALEKAA